MQIEIDPAFRGCRWIVVQSGLSEGRRIPVLHKAWMLSLEVGKCLGLYTLRLHTVCGAPELVPLLAYDAVTQQVTTVHGNVLKLTAPRRRHRPNANQLPALSAAAPCTSSQEEWRLE